MARIRSIKPEFWRSPDIKELDYFQRLLYIGLWNLADDEGRGVYDLAAIAADLFLTEYSLNPHGVLTEASCAFEEYQKRDMVHLYSVKNRHYFQVVKWDEHQRINRPSKSKIPPPDQGEPIIHGGLTESSLNTHGGLTVGTGNRDQGSGIMKITCSSVDEPASSTQTTYSKEFETWWNHYPRKQAKRKAFNEWKRATKRINREELNAKTRDFANFHETQQTDKQYIPLPTTWLARDGWEDELISRREQSSQPSSIDAWLPPVNPNIVDGELADEPNWNHPKELPPW